jgi:hypothetical protein
LNKGLDFGQRFDLQTTVARRKIVFDLRRITEKDNQVTSAQRNLPTAVVIYIWGRSLRVEKGQCPALRSS